MLFETELYRLEYNRDKNRIYFKLMGFWASPTDVPHFVSEWHDVLNHTEKGFTVLVDAEEMVTPPQEIVELHETIQKMVLAAGATKRAEIVAKSNISKMTVQRISSSSGIELISKRFNNFKEADDWLDSVS